MKNPRHLAVIDYKGAEITHTWRPDLGLFGEDRFEVEMKGLQCSAWLKSLSAAKAFVTRTLAARTKAEDGPTGPGFDSHD